MPIRSRRFAAGAALLIPLIAAAQGGPLPADVKAACDTAFAIVSKAAGIKTRRSNGTFNDQGFRAPIPGCRIQVDGSFKKARTGSAVDLLHTGLDARGWDELLEFSSDGPDGTSFAFRKDSVACFARGEWDGGADDEPGVPAGDSYKLTAICGKAAMFTRAQ
jgi:hypothetical protein